MRLGKCVAKNFGSYENLEIDFSDMGLTLAYGPTGSGKSTLADLTCWVIFGITAKDGSVDDVRSWTNPGEPTIVSQEVLLNAYKIIITRTRGNTAQNDLFWCEQDNEGKKIRGKDLSDTQKLLNARLGFDAETYLTAAYFHEFSDTGKFFTASAKDRRALFDRIVSMEFPTTINLYASERRKALKALISETRRGFDQTTGKLQQCVSSTTNTAKVADEWGSTQSGLCAELSKKANNFQEDRLKLIKLHTLNVDSWNTQQSKLIEKSKNTLQSLKKEIKEQNWEGDIKGIKKAISSLGKERCRECGSATSSTKQLAMQERLSNLEKDKAKDEFIRDNIYRTEEEICRLVNEVNPNIPLLTAAQNMENKYEEQLLIEQKRTNPHTAQCILLDAEIKQLRNHVQAQKTTLEEQEHKFNALERLSDLSQELRGVLLKNAVVCIQNTTNEYLERYFDSEIRVEFTVEGADKLDISIQKNGYVCNYKQLSKGQRQLLKLCFVVSVMKAASDKAGTHFDNLFMDEALDGLDTSLKLKAFSLFEALSREHSSILMIDHAPEFQTLFNKKYKVALIEDKSYIEEEV